MKNTKTKKQHPEHIKQELIMLDNMIGGKFGTVADLDNIKPFFSQETIDIYREEEKRKHNLKRKQHESFI